ncbi:MAG: hypothetical protein JKY37_27985 [Nannocystaceae bacterium]|nr:hypothetical protein [Nannocystaceae bacterium]
MHDRFATPGGRGFLGLLSLTLLSTVPACDPGESGKADDPHAWEFPNWTKDDSLGDGPSRTSDPNVRIFRGYNVVTDDALGENCVIPDEQRYVAGSVEWAETMTLVETLEELNTALGIDAKAQVKAGPLGIDAGVQFSKSFRSSDTSLTLLLRTAQSYAVMNRDRVRLSETALQLAESSPADFTRKCGTHYVAGVQFGAELRVMITIETSSSQDKQELKTQLGLKGIKAGPADIGGQIKTEVSNLLAQKALRVSARAEAIGFTTSKSLAAIENDPLEGSGGLVEALKAELAASVDRDLCNDGGQCDGAVTVGYKENSNRSARPIAVEKRAYRAAVNFPQDDQSVDAFIEHDNEAAVALSLVEKHARVYTTTTRIYNEEVDAIRTSDTPYDFALYARNAFGELAAQESALLNYADQQADIFGQEDGTAVRAIAESLNACWDRAVRGDFSGCQTRTGLDEVYDILERYSKKRIRPVFYTVAEDTEEWDDISCPSGSRLPDRFEGSRLYAAVMRNPDIPAPRYTEGFFENENHGIWVTDTEGYCDANEGLWLQYWSGNKLSYGCIENRLDTTDIELPVLCVPNAGPFGTAVFEL